MRPRGSERSGKGGHCAGQCGLSQLNGAGTLQYSPVTLRVKVDY
jgi:hypothetical protein